MILDEINNTLCPELLKEWHNGLEGFQTALGLKIEAKLDKMKDLELEHNTPVKWISKRIT